MSGEVSANANKRILGIPSRLNGRAGGVMSGRKGWTGAGAGFPGSDTCSGTLFVTKKKYQHTVDIKNLPGPPYKSTRSRRGRRGGGGGRGGDTPSQEGRNSDYESKSDKREKQPPEEDQVRIEGETKKFEKRTRQYGCRRGEGQKEGPGKERGRGPG